MAEEAYFHSLHAAGDSLAAEKGHRIDSRYAEYRQLIARAVEVFGTEIDATRWLSTQSADFAGRSPLQDLIQEGPDHALDVLGKIEHGVFF